MIIKSVPTPPFERQSGKLGKYGWQVTKLVQLSKGFEVMDIPLAHLSLWKRYDVTLRELVGHMETVLSADLDLPIILDEDGEILDGRHRVMRAILDGKETVKAVRFEVNPPPCEVFDV